MSREVRMINSARSLESMRDLGIDLETGLKELIDNSIDASASQIRLHICKSKQDRLKIMVADDGVGIPLEVAGKPHVKHTVQHVLRFGGKIQHKGTRYPIGRFGFGLSQTVLCLTTQSIVYSKCLDSKIRTCYYDLDELMDSEAQLPEENQIDSIPESDLPPHWELKDQGTLVVLSEIDKSGWKDVDGFAEHLDVEIGRIYRRLISSGLKITISLSTSEEVTQVLARDPLGQLPFSHEVNAFGVMPITAVSKLVFDGKDLQKIPEIIDPNTGHPAEIHVKLVRFDIDKVWNVLDVEHTTGTMKNRKLLTEWGFSTEGQGFSIMRNGRELRHAQTLGFFSKNNSYNYFRGEIEFPTCLDRYFNVQTIKGRYSIDPGLKDALLNRCSSVISRIAKESAAQRSSKKVLSSMKYDTLKSERMTQKLKANLKRKEISEAELLQKKQDLEARKKSVIVGVDRIADQKLSDAIENLQLAKHSNDEDEIKSAQARVELVKKETDSEKKSIRNRFQVDAFCRKWIKPLRDGALYAIEDYHDEIWVTINSESDFFQSLYERASQYPEQTSLLDLIIFAVAYSEADQSNSDEMKEFWKDVRRKLSRLTYLFVNMVKFEEDLPEKTANN